LNINNNFQAISSLITTLNATIAAAQSALAALEDSALEASNNLSDLASASTARTNLGLGSAATSNTSAFDSAGSASAVNTALTTHAALTTAHGATASNTASKIVSRDASGNFSAGTITATLSGTAQNVTGTVLVTHGGTGQTSLTGMLKGNGTSAVTSGTDGTDYVSGTHLGTVLGNYLGLSGGTMEGNITLNDNAIIDGGETIYQYNAFGDGCYTSFNGQFYLGGFAGGSNTAYIGSDADGGINFTDHGGYTLNWNQWDNDGLSIQGNLWMNGSYNLYLNGSSMTGVSEIIFSDSSSMSTAPEPAIPGGMDPGIYVADDGSGTISLDWNNRCLLDCSCQTSINWNFRQLIDQSNQVAIDYQNKALMYGGQCFLTWDGMCVAIASAQPLYITCGIQFTDNTFQTTAYTGGGGITPGGMCNSQYWACDSGSTCSLDWSNRFLEDNGACVSLDWQNRCLVSSGGYPILNWNCGQIQTYYSGSWSTGITNCFQDQSGNWHNVVNGLIVS
jgi:hypothetical protein